LACHGCSIAKKSALSRRMRGKMPVPHTNMESGSPGRCFFAGHEEATPIFSLEHQCPPVSAAFKNKTGPQWLLVSDSPQHACPPTLLAERVRRVNEQEPTFFF
jgi:hypothetical protein